jgi:hypothetical protein
MEVLAFGEQEVGGVDRPRGLHRSRELTHLAALDRIAVSISP